MFFLIYLCLAHNMFFERMNGDALILTHHVGAGMCY